MFRSDTLFAKIMNTVADVLFIGILWVIMSIPIITAGAAGTAAYYAMAKCVRHNTGYIFGEFWKSFKQNFKQSLPLTIIFWLSMVIVALDIWYVWNNTGKFYDAMFVILLFVAFIIMGLCMYVCPVLSRFNKKNLDVLKTSLFMFFKFLPLTVLGVVVFLGMLIGIFLMPWGIFVFPGAYVFLLSLPMERILKRMLPPVEEGSEEAQKWYYQ